MTKSHIRRKLNLWAYALESGKYQQGIDELCRTKGGKKKFCCLGVLCEIEKIPKEKFGDSYEYDSSFVKIPTKLSEKLTLVDESGFLKNNCKISYGGRYFDSLISFNDCSGSKYRFRIIANLIRNYPGVISKSFKKPRKGTYKLGFGAELIVS